DPQGPIFTQWPIAISAIRFTRCVGVSSVSWFCDLAKNLRQNPHEVAAGISLTQKALMRLCKA
ncbi:hypothetical protein, partial [Rhizobium sp. NZLR4b]|uniref:hypothetical protein n=1 Tax=Rhizobium sp. NZLR4b TaxID=2731102 RepID=UPI001C836531